MKQNIISKLLLMLIAALFLNGCATYYEQKYQTQCLTKDWYAFGFDTAKAGKDKIGSWNRFEENCIKYNIWSDQKSFSEGYQHGLDSFCTEVNGFEFGQRNNSYSPICPAEKQRIFDAAYEDGADLHYAGHNLQVCINNVENLRSDIDYYISRREKLAYLIDSGDLEKDEAKKYVKERYSLKQDIASARSDMYNYQDKIEDYRREQSSLEYKLFAKYYGRADKVNTRHSGYSYDESVSRERVIVNEPAIILYKPEGMDHKTKNHYKQIANQLSKYISGTQPRSFRYQVVRNTELKIDTRGKKRHTYHTGRDFSGATLIMWAGSGTPTIEPISFDVKDAPIPVVNDFFNSL